MDAHSLEVLEFPQVLALVGRHCATARGRERAALLRPETDPDRVLALQAETAEAVAVLERAVRPPWGGVKDIRPQLVRLAAAAALTAPDLWDVLETVRSARRLREMIMGEPATILLRRLAEGIVPLEALESALESAIVPEGMVSDAASPELQRLRRLSETLTRRVRERLESYLHDPELVRALREPIITLRSGRHVLAVRAEERARIPGLVHDASQTGATLFVEPMPVVELGNQLREVEAREAAEVERILRELTQAVRAVEPAIAATLDALAELDVIFARASLARDQGAVASRMGPAGRMRLVKARHPLLGSQAVPLDLEIEDPVRLVVITGPNTGGKTVTLKTVGLMAAMAQCGLFLPAAEGTELPVFQEIFADIGDEQSLLQSLSTFSAHMAHIVRILRQAGPHSLVLLDEVGAGTDPAEGAALAMAILEELLERGCMGAASTHQGELKLFAHTHPGLVNAAMEFDPVTLQPTYRIRVGTPGRSNALAVAQRLGLEEAVVARARAHLSHDSLRVDEVLAALEQEREGLAQARAAAAAQRAEAEILRQRAARELESAEERARGLLASARETLDEERLAMRAKLEAAHRALRAARAPADPEAALRELDALRRELRAEPRPVRRPLLAPRPNGEPGVDDWVELLRYGQLGRVVERHGDEYLVEVGALRLRVDRSELLPAQPDAPAPAASRDRNVGIARRIEVRPELDIRGMSVEEGLEALDRYLDDARLAGLAQARIIHGRGTGRLRQAVQAFLAEHPEVEAQRPGGPGEGGDGATVVTLES